MSDISRFNSYGRAEFSADGSLVDYVEHQCLVDKKDSQIKDLQTKLKASEEECERLRNESIRSNRELDLTWYAIKCTVDDYAQKRLKKIYKREQDKLNQGDEG